MFHGPGSGFGLATGLNAPERLPLDQDQTGKMFVKMTQVEILARRGVIDFCQFSKVLNSVVAKCASFAFDLSQYNGVIGMLSDEDRELIRTAPRFDGLGDDALERLLEAVEIAELPQDAVLFREGERPRFLHILLAGKAGLVGTGSDGRETRLVAISCG